MRTISRQPEIGHRSSPDRGPWALASARPGASGLARMLVGLALAVLLAQPAAAEKDESSEKSAIPSWYTQTFVRGDAGLNITLRPERCKSSKLRKPSNFRNWTNSQRRKRNYLRNTPTITC